MLLDFVLDPTADSSRTRGARRMTKTVRTCVAWAINSPSSNFKGIHLVAICERLGNNATAITKLHIVDRLFPGMEQVFR